MANYRSDFQFHEGAITKEKYERIMATRDRPLTDSGEIPLHRGLSIRSDNNGGIKGRRVA